MHTIKSFLDDSVQLLQAAGIETARLDCLVLLEDALGKNRASILAYPELLLNETQLEQLNKQLKSRINHVPLAYIRRKAFFYGREFYVDEHVLVPRPETESMVELLKTLPVNKPRIADVGTGSGCIGITVALELPGSQVTLYDVDSQALAVAQRNAAALGAAVTLRQTDMLDGMADTDIILTNLPYVPTGFAINAAAAHEPPTALFAGVDGLDDYRTFWSQLAVRTQLPQYVLTESLPTQHAGVTALAKPAGYTQRAVDGFVQLFERTTD